MIKREIGGRKPVGLADVLNKAIEIMGKDNALQWWMNPSQELGNIPPYKYCLNGGGNKLMMELHK